MITLVPKGEKFPGSCKQEHHTMKEAWEWRGPTEWRCDLAQGMQEEGTRSCYLVSSYIMGMLWSNHFIHDGYEIYECHFKM